MTTGFVMFIAFSFVVVYACYIRVRIQEYMFIQRMKRWNADAKRRQMLQDWMIK